jgi:hypothetical protein
MLKYLRPTPNEIERIALRETDLHQYSDFEPITRGPIVAVLILTGVCCAAAILVPLSLIRRLLDIKR